MKAGRIHYRRGGVPICRVYQGEVLGTSAIRSVTCKVCLKELWKEIALAHYRAFGAGKTTAFGRRMRAALRESELDTRRPSRA